MAARRDGWAAQRGRSLVVVAILVGSAIALIASTQVWAQTSVAGVELEATGADALALLQPLALAGLALSLALALTGTVTRLLFAGVAVILGVAIAWLAAPVAVFAPLSAVESVVTEHTGIAGSESVADIISPVDTTAWPAVAAVAGVLVVLAGVAGLATGARWRRGSARYESSPAVGRRGGTGPLDAVDSWDDLTRGDDPTRSG